MKYKIAFLGKSKNRTRTTFHIDRAFKERGHETLRINPARMKRKTGSVHDLNILNEICAFQPDLVFIYSNDIPVFILREVKKIGFTTFQYYEDLSFDIYSGLKQRAQLVDFFLVTNKGMENEYKTAGIPNPHYFTGGCDMHDHRIQQPILPLWRSDIAFIGAARLNHPRLELIKKIRDKYNLKLYGKYWKNFGFQPTLYTVKPRGYRLICSGSKIILGSDITCQVEGYWSNRLWLTLGCGGFFLTNYVKGLENFFENKRDLVWYHNHEECLELIEEYLQKPAERMKIARRGFAKVHEKHTFHHFVDRLIALYEANTDPSPNPDLGNVN